MTEIDNLIMEAKNCKICEKFLPCKPNPVFSINSKAKILLIGQAPGSVVQATGLPWNDRSGDRLRQWLNLDRKFFYNPEIFAITSMGFCYPGVNAKGGDLPPRRECAPTWHHKMQSHMPNIKLIILIGSYAQQYYLPIKSKNMTENIYNWRNFLPKFITLPHPSWRNNGWLRKNPWFEQDLVPELRNIVNNIIIS